MKYRRLVNGLNDRGALILATVDADQQITNHDQDWYLSTFKYNEEHKSVFQETGTIAGIIDVTTDRLWFDFDSEFEPEVARQDAITLCKRIIDKGVDNKDLIITFSGGKGFGVELNLTTELSPREVKNIAFELAQDLTTFDVKMYNASRILRMLGTKHQKTGLYKTPLTFTELQEYSVDDIMKKAKSVRDGHDHFRWNDVTLPESIHITKELEVVPFNQGVVITKFLDYTSKPKNLSRCRWAIQNGHFKAGERSTALLCIASTYKNQGFDQEIVYRMLKGVAELQANVNNQERFSDVEIYNNIILQVFSPLWKNGQYTCRDKGNWLETFCSKLDFPCNHKEEDDLKPKTLMDLELDFKNYVVNIDKNTIKTGLPTLDKYVFLSTGANVVIVAAAGAGKTSVGLEILENTSRAGIRSVVASLDMAKNRIFEKVLYRLTGYGRQQLYTEFQENKQQETMKKLKESYGNVNFFKKSSSSVQDLKDYVIRCNEQGGDKIKLVVVDYFERLSSELGDDTAASKRTAGELQDLVDDLDICLITLMQPNKNALFGGPDSPIYDYTKIKGSSFVYQSPRIILSCWRPFYNPKDFSNDKFMQMAVLKNDLGELSEFSFNWEGKRGAISEMEQEQRQEFEELLKEKANKEPKGNSGALNF